jgi:hypothetical protein
VRGGGDDVGDRGSVAEQQRCGTVTTETFVGRTGSADPDVGGQRHAAGGGSGSPRRKSTAARPTQIRRK